MDMKSVEELTHNLGEAVKTIPELYHDGIQPAVQETGKTLALIPRSINAALAGLQQWIAHREYNVEETKKLLAIKLEKVGADKIVPPEPYIAVPAIQALSYSMNSDVLRNMYANLLATSMNIDQKWNVHPSFVEVIKQLSPDEAKILNFLTNDSYPIIDLKLVRPGGKFSIILKNYTNIADNICEHPDKIFSYLDNLKRLELIEISFDSYIANESVYKQLENHPNVKKVQDSGIKKMDKEDRWEFDRKYFQLTQYGRDFKDVCVKESV